MPAESTQDPLPSPVTPARHGALPAKLIPVLLALVMLLAAALRLADLRSKPRWYADELFNLKVIQDLLDGELRVRAVSWTCFSPFHPYPIGFHLFGGVFCLLLGDDIWSIRFFCGLVGVATTFFVFLAGRAVYDERAGLIAAVAYSIHPKIVLFTRWAFPQNLSPVFVAAAVWAALRYRQHPTRGWLAAFSLLVGGSIVSIYWAGPLLFFFAGVVLLTQPRRIFFALGLALSPLFLQFAAAILIQGADAVLYDLSHLFGVRVVQADDPAGGILPAAERILKGYGALFLRDPFFLFGLFGLLWLPVRWHAAAILTALGLLSLPPVAQRGPILADFFYNAVFFAPLPLIGFGALFARILHSGADIHDVIPRSYARLTGTILTLTALGFGWFIVFRDTVTPLVPGGYETRLDSLGFTVTDHADAQDAARFINDRTSPEDFVIATPNLPWMLSCRSTDVQQMASLFPGGTIWYPTDMPRNRYLYNLSHETARFLVLDNLTFTFYLTVRNCDEVLYRIHEERWPLVGEFGEFRIFQNPRLGGSDAARGDFPVLPAKLQLRLAELHETRGHSDAAVRWYVRAAEEGGKPVLEELQYRLGAEPSRSAIRDALEQLREREASGP